MEEQQGTIEIERHGNVSVVSLVGEHDLVTAAVVREELDGLVGQDQGLVVSLMQTTFFDSAIVHALFQSHRDLKDHGRKLVLHVNTASIVRRVLDISGLADCVDCTASLDEALAVAGSCDGGKD